MIGVLQRSKEVTGVELIRSVEKKAAQDDVVIEVELQDLNNTYAPKPSHVSTHGF